MGMKESDSKEFPIALIQCLDRLAKRMKDMKEVHSEWSMLSPLALHFEEQIHFHRGSTNLPSVLALDLGEVMNKCRCAQRHSMLSCSSKVAEGGLKIAWR